MHFCLMHSSYCWSAWMKWPLTTPLAKIGKASIQLFLLVRSWQDHWQNQGRPSCLNANEACISAGHGMSLTKFFAYIAHLCSVLSEEIISFQCAFAYLWNSACKLMDRRKLRKEWVTKTETAKEVYHCQANIQSWWWRESISGVNNKCAEQYFTWFTIFPGHWLKYYVLTVANCCFF